MHTSHTTQVSSFTQRAVTVTDLPFNRLLGIRKTDGGPQMLSLPRGGQYLDSLGTVHASAQLALAEASAGEHLLRLLGSDNGVVGVVRRMDAKFRQPAHGEIASTTTISHDKLDQFAAEFLSKGRASVTVDVELHDQAGAHTLSANVEWFLTRSLDTSRRSKMG